MINLNFNKKNIIIAVAILFLLTAGLVYYFLSHQSITKTNDGSKQVQNIEIDSNGDGLPDSKAKALGLNPNRTDTDDDGIFDVDEINLTNTNPAKADSDGDGYSDLQELRSGNNPNLK